MTITLFNEQTSNEFTADMEFALKDVVKQTGISEDIDGTVNLLITDDEAIKKLNSEFREKDCATDVLSFPAYNFIGLLKDNKANIDWEYENDLPFLGDIAISLERAYKQAEEYGHSPLRETAFLTLHGLLHILGYDHISKEDEKIMTACQKEILDKTGIDRD